MAQKPATGTKRKNTEAEGARLFTRPSFIFGEGYKGSPLIKVRANVHSCPVGAGWRSFILMEAEDGELIFFYWPSLIAMSEFDVPVNWRRVVVEEIDAADLLSRILEVKEVCDKNDVAISRGITLYVIEVLTEMEEDANRPPEPPAIDVSKIRKRVRVRT